MVWCCCKIVLPGTAWVLINYPSKILFPCPVWIIRPTSSKGVAGEDADDDSVVTAVVARPTAEASKRRTTSEAFLISTMVRIFLESWNGSLLGC